MTRSKRRNCGSCAREAVQPYLHCGRRGGVVLSVFPLVGRASQDPKLAYIPHYPEAEDGVLACIEGEVTDDLRNATYQVRTDLQAMRSLGDTLRAHIPD